MVGVMAPVPVFAEGETGGSASGGGEQCSGGSFFGLDPWYKYLTCSNGNIAQENFQGERLRTTVWKIVLTILGDLFVVAGVVAVVLIVMAGIKFMTAAGDPGAVAAAKKAITAAIVGLVIVILAKVLVNTVLTVITGGSGGQF